MILPNNPEDMSDAELKRWLIKEGDYDSDAADYIIEVVRGRVHAEDLE